MRGNLSDWLTRSCNHNHAGYSVRPRLGKGRAHTRLGSLSFLPGTDPFATSQARVPANAWRWRRVGGGDTQGAAVCTPAGEAAPGIDPKARRRRSNRPGNSQAKGLRGEGRSGKRRTAQAIGPLTEGVSRVSMAPPWGRPRGESLRVQDRGGISRTPGGVRFVGGAPVERTRLGLLHRGAAAHTVV